MISKNDIPLFREVQRVIDRGKDYIYLLPHHKLRNYISNYTITFPNKSMFSENYTIIPHGSATLVYGYSSNQYNSNLFGPTTKPCIVGYQANLSTMLFIIEFQPAGLFSFTGINQKELVDSIIPFELINPLLNKQVIQKLDQALKIDDLITELDSFLLSKLLISQPDILKLSTKLINDTRGNITSKELSNNIYYSERHINRIFDQYFGMGTKSYSRLVRINHAIRLLNNPRNSLTLISDSVGFYDLPHFIHDFKTTCGITPQEFRSNMSDFYSEIAKF